MVASFLIAVSILSFSLQGWNDFWQGLAVVSLAIAFIAGFGANRTGKKMSEEQNREIAVLKESTEKQKGTNLALAADLEKQREKTALAEKAAMDLNELIKEPRSFDRAKANEILDWGEKGMVAFGFLSGAEEGGKLAEDLANFLAEHGWKVTELTPQIVAGTVPAGIRVTIPGDTTKELSSPDDAPEPAKTLCRLLVETLKGNPAVQIHLHSELMPKDVIRVRVGPKY